MQSNSCANGKSDLQFMCLHKKITYFPQTLKAVRDCHKGFCCPNRKDFFKRKIFLFFGSSPLGFSCIIALSAIYCVNKNFY